MKGLEAFPDADLSRFEDRRRVCDAVLLAIAETSTMTGAHVREIMSGFEGDEEDEEDEEFERRNPFL